VNGNLREIGKKLDLKDEDIIKMRRRRIKDIIITGISGSVIAIISMLVGFGVGNTEKYGMAYYPYAFVPLIVSRPDRVRYAIFGIGALVTVLASILMYLNGFEAGKVFYSNSIDYGVYRCLP
jgi:hypothetical protein